MIKRYENQLTDVLETVANEGFAVVPKWKIMRWYGQSNFTIAIRRDIRERWASIAEELEWTETPPLRVAECRDGRDIILMNKETFWRDDEE